MLIVGSLLNPLTALLEGFKRQLNVIRATDRQDQVALDVIASATSARGSSPARQRTESPYAQRPSGFDQAAFNESTCSSLGATTRLEV